MTCLPAPLLRGLTVLAVGATLVASHAAFAAPGRGVSSTESSAGVERVSLIAGKDRASAATTLAENCYLETHIERPSKGKAISTLVQECD
jgi:hypothetical protein